MRELARKRETAFLGFRPLLQIRSEVANPSVPGPGAALLREQTSPSPRRQVEMETASKIQAASMSFLKKNGQMRRRVHQRQAPLVRLEELEMLMRLLPKILRC